MDTITKQQPLGTRYGHFARPEDVIAGVSLHGKNAVVSGGYTGIGLHTTRALAGAGAHVIVLARDVERAQRHLRHVHGVEIVYFDLLKPQSIDAAANRILRRQMPVHILVNSAGIIGIPLTRDARGYEYQFATNHLGHFQLTARLYPALKAAHGARVVLISSRGHRWGGVLFDDPSFARTPYSPNRAYAQSKSAISLFAHRLDMLARKDGVRAFAVHPGPIPSSDLFAESFVGIKPDWQVSLARVSARLMRGLHITGLLNAVRRPQTADAYKTIRQGAATPVWCAVSGTLDGMGGVYCEDCDIARAVAADSEAHDGVWPWAIDAGLAARSWALSEAMTGLRFMP